MILSNLFSTVLKQIGKMTGQGSREVARLLEEGSRLQQSGDREEAIRRYEHVLARDPDNADAHYRIGVAHAQSERYGVAEQHLLRAVTLRPDFAGAHIDLGNVYRLRHDIAAAEASYRNALALDGDTILAHFNLAKLLKELGRLGEALDHLRRAHRLESARGDVLRGLVTGLLEGEQYQEAIAAGEQTAKHFPQSYEAQLCLGLAYQNSHMSAEALECYDGALGLRTDDPELHNNRGISLQELGRLDEALASYDRAIELNPDYPLAKCHRGLAYLMMGDYSRGWADYEARLLGVDKPVRPLSLPRWDGTPLAGRTVLVYGDQGLGDEMMFASCLPEVIRDATHCIIECAPKLTKLFARSFPDATVYARTPGQPAPTIDRLRAVDAEVPSSSLGLYYRRALSAFPSHTGYLVADPQRVQYWKGRLAELGSGQKIGISWKGGTFQTRSPKRSIALEQWLPILSAANVKFISLQYTDNAVSELAALRQQHGVDIVHWSEAIEDYDETAALVTALDLTISVCTAVIHLGGALGRPVWVMAPYSPEWRYGWVGERMPWYPSVCIFRQKVVGDWCGVIATTAGRLRHFERRQET